MSLLFPTTKQEGTWAGWLFALLFAGSLALLAASYWSVYPSSEAHFSAFGAALLLSVPAVVLLLVRAHRLVSRGLHLYYSKGRPVPIGQQFMTWLGVLFVLYFGLQALLAVAVWFPLGASLDRSFVVAEAKPCKRKCSGCSHRVKLASWSGSEIGSLCAEHIEPRLQQGERVVVRGRFSALGVYVESLRRASAS